MKTLLRATAFALLAAFALTGCFEINEEIQVNKDFSGTYRFTFGVTEQAQQMIEAFERMAEERQEAEEGDEGDPSQPEGAIIDKPMSEEDEEEPEEEEEDRFAETVMRLKSVPGVSNVRQLEFDNEYDQGLSFDFADLETLNKAVAICYEMPSEPELFSAKGKRFSYDPTKIVAKLFEGFKAEAGDAEDQMAAGMLEGMLSSGDARFTSSITFERGVKKTSLERATVSADGRTVTIAAPLAEALEGEGMPNTVKLR